MTPASAALTRREGRLAPAGGGVDAGWAAAPAEITPARRQKAVKSILGGPFRWPHWRQ
jgi:hypothetical protein